MAFAHHDTKIRINFKSNWWLQHEDMESRVGRIRFWSNVTDPIKSIVSNNTLNQYKNDLKETHARLGDGDHEVTFKDFKALCKKKHYLLSSVHPDTGEFLPWFARTSSLLATNIPIFTAMMLSKPTVANTIFWQIVNQTYNAGFNFCNRNASSTTTTSQILQSYCLAVGSSIGAAFGIRKAFALMLGESLVGMTAVVVNSLVNYGAVSFSSSLNVYCMRKPEIEQGISLLDPETM